MPINTIGQFTFLALDGNPLAVTEGTIVKDRPGVDGVAVWKTGERGRRFTLRSCRDGFDFPHAHFLYTVYRQLVGTMVDVIWNSIPLTDGTTRAIVLDVRPVNGRTFAMLGGVGGLSSPSYGWVECDWDLVFVDVQT